ncbi:TonB-dependent receptor [Novosphingobium nitrogenifigens DSM 19370]|uniref:TonB-dependent receptor n=1 Tax=Novosphingobium nitrogenifigens DSM 19370 TaxID=983920 RepID=F1Z583_9SPHN|nr:TonB-dependent receptor [Novosphingobium nitrogenifigens]EGD60261.1 TonB-dependent receptor [Novosphingobium nitrogenifigens DSM 19370]
MFVRNRLRASISILAFVAAAHAGLAHAEDAAPAAAPANAGSAKADAGDAGSAIIVTAKTTRSATAVTGAEIQKILPGVSPLKAIQTLPGVFYVTADPWGNNEQNAQIFIHGFNYQQLGYTLDGLPLGDQNYGNYNGLAPQRAVISENVGRAVVSTGAGDLGTASTSNLGGAIETFTSDPKANLGLDVAETIGSYGTSRTYARVDTGSFGPGKETRAYLSFARQRARAWDFNGIQGGWQANAKLVHENTAGKLTAYFDYSDKTEPNEDATSYSATQTYTPYTRPYLYPNYGAQKSYLDAYGNTPTADGSNYRNYYSDAQRTDYLAYLKYDAYLSDKITWSNQVYFHHNDGVGVVAGPLGQSITVIQAYLDPNYATDTHFTGNHNGLNNTALGSALVAATGGSGLVIRTTEYRIDREGFLSTLHANLGAHQIEFGAWFEHNSATQWRRWYGADDSNPSSFSPYIRPTNPLFTQYQGEARVEELQLHLQDTWRLTPRLLVEGGFKTSAQWANGWYPIQPATGSLSGLSGGLPQGRINTLRWFLPAFGAKYDLTSHEQLYLNVQKNLRQYMTYLGGASLSPWFTGSQAAFDTFASQGKPETSWTYEIGLRSRRTFTGSPLSAIEAQVNYYHVVFNNRQLAINTNPGGIAGSGITGGTAILVNVGSVHTDGVDAAFTLHFGQQFSLYNALSYNRSTYQSDYTSTANGIGAATGTCGGGTNVVATCGKVVPGSPTWMNKTVASLNLGALEAQVIGDYIGSRYATYTNDTSVPSTFQASARVTLHLPAEKLHVAKADVSLNVTNISNTTGASSLSIGSASKNYSVYPIAPRQWFVTFGLGF